MAAPALHSQADWEVFVRLIAKGADGTRSPMPVDGRTIRAAVGLPDGPFIAEVEATIASAETATIRVFVPFAGRVPVKITRQAFLNIDVFDVTGGGRRFLARAVPSLISGPSNV